MDQKPYLVILCLSALAYPCSSQITPTYALIMFFLLTIIQIKCVLSIIK